MTELAAVFSVLALAAMGVLVFLLMVWDSRRERRRQKRRFRRWT